MSYQKLTIEQLLDKLNHYDHTELHVHHTWRPNHSNFNGSNHVRIQDGMRNYHVKTNKWDDIAQHVTLFPDGVFLTGRDFSKQPVSIKGYNGSRGKIPFCVEMVGDFDIGQDVFEGQQKDSMLQLAKFFDDRKKYIRFHRENAPKTCPGTSIDKNVFMKEVRNYNPKEEEDDMAKALEPVEDLTPGQENALKRLKSIGFVAQDYKPSSLDLHYFSMFDIMARKAGLYDKK
jgi:hypothetical protein